MQYALGSAFLDTRSDMQSHRIWEAVIKTDLLGITIEQRLEAMIDLTPS